MSAPPGWPTGSRSSWTVPAAAAEAARILQDRRVVPVHYDSWSHFTEGRDELVAAFTAAGLGNRLDLGDRG